MASAETAPQNVRLVSAEWWTANRPYGYMEDERDATSKLTVKSWFAIDTD